MSAILTASDPKRTFGISALKQRKRQLRTSLFLVGMAIAAALWVLSILWLIRIVGFSPGASIEDVLGTRSPVLIAVISIPFAVLVALTGEAIAKGIQSVLGKAD